MRREGCNTQFQCDGTSQIDYEVFRDLLSFDTTYEKNKHKFLIVIFSSVNNHDKTIWFATVVVSNKIEETYVWLFEQLLEVMKRKVSTYVITDGDLAMRNAIKKVFTTTHHRLCAWHLY